MTKVSGWYDAELTFEFPRHFGASLQNHPGLFRVRILRSSRHGNKCPRCLGQILRHGAIFPMYLILLTAFFCLLH